MNNLQINAAAYIYIHLSFKQRNTQNKKDDDRHICTQEKMSNVGLVRAAR